MTLNEPVHLRYVNDVTSARWVFDRPHPFAHDVGSIIPPGFESYARLSTQHPSTIATPSLVEDPLYFKRTA